MGLLKNRGELRKTILGGLIGLLGLAAHAAIPSLTIQARFSYNEYRNEKRPSQFRKEFKETTGYQISGWESEIEDDRPNIMAIAAAIHKRQLIKPFTLEDGLRISSPNFLKQNLSDQYDTLFKPAIGHATDKDMTLKTSSLTYYQTFMLTSHELAHVNIFEMEKESEFKEKWAKLANDENGKSLYNPIPWWDFSNTIGLRSIPSGHHNHKHNHPLNESLGFITDHSRENVDEHIAEFIEETESHPGKFAKWLYGTTEERNSIMEKQLSLAEEYNLVSPAFRDYARLAGINNNIKNNSRNGGDSRSMFSHTMNYLKFSDKFLNEHKDSIYECEVAQKNANVKSIMLKQDLISAEQVENTYQRSLNSPYKDPGSYLNSLKGLEKLYEYQGDTKKAEIYNQAINLYNKREDRGTLGLTRDGVNRFLKRNNAI